MENPKINKRQKAINSFKKFLPEGFEEYIVDLFFEHSIHFKIVPPRKTKHRA